MEVINDMREAFIAAVRGSIRRSGVDELMEWLETTDWYSAPASTRYHLAREGGLAEHSINVYKRLLRLYETEYGEIPCGRKETLAIAALFHDICKADIYKEEWKNVKVYRETGSKYDAGGRFDWETQRGYAVDEKFRFGYHGAKSVFLIERHMKLTAEEAVSIANHMGAYDRNANDYSVGAVFERYPLALLLHTADCLASFIDEAEK